ncbi:MAG: hypothetical protein V4739_04725 [Pseudomonadota bacterium]
MQIAPSWMRPILWGALVLGSSAYLGNYHVLYGSGLHKSHVVLRKVSWSLSETFVNLDALSGQPAFMAHANFPLTIAAMEDYNLLPQQKK